MRSCRAELFPGDGQLGERHENHLKHKPGNSHSRNLKCRDPQTALFALVAVRENVSIISKSGPLHFAFSIPKERIEDRLHGFLGIVKGGARIVQDGLHVEEFRLP